MLSQKMHKRSTLMQSRWRVRSKIHNPNKQHIAHHSVIFNFRKYKEDGAGCQSIDAGAKKAEIGMRLTWRKSWATLFPQHSFQFRHFFFSFLKRWRKHNINYEITQNVKEIQPKEGCGRMGMALAQLTKGPRFKSFSLDVEINSQTFLFPNPMARAIWLSRLIGDR